MKNKKDLSIFKYIGEVKWYVFINIFFFFLTALASVGVPFITQMVTKAAKDSAFHDMYVAFGLIGTIFILKIFCSWILNKWGSLLGVKMEVNMRRDAVDKLLRIKMQVFDKVPTGTFISRANNDLKEIPNFIKGIPEQLIIGLVTSVGGVTYAFMQTWVMGVVFIGILLLGTLGYLAIRVRWMALFYKIREQNSWMSASIGKQVDGITEIKSFGAEKYEKARFAKIQDAYLKTYKKFFSFEGIYMAMSMLMMLSTTFIALVIGGVLLANHKIGIAQYVGLTSAAAMLNQPIQRFSAIYNIYARGGASVKRFKEYMLWEEEENASNLIAPFFKGVIEFKNVTFSYKDASDKVVSVFKNMNLKIKAGEKVAFVGKTGIGKSTVLKLLLRYYEINKGAILIDGVDIREYDLQSLRTQLGYIQQQSVIFDDSIANNISYSSTGLNKADVKYSAKLAMLDSFIEKMNDGYDTLTGTKGASLSGGQKQRLSMARVFLSKSSIMLLDEATSALDNNTEKEIKKSIDKITKAKTTLIVAHRLSTIKDADRIIVLAKGGKIVEEGTYEELEDKKNYFYNLSS